MAFGLSDGRLQCNEVQSLHHTATAALWSAEFIQINPADGLSCFEISSKMIHLNKIMFQGCLFFTVDSFFS